jgi:hypothetical protein
MGFTKFGTPKRKKCSMCAEMIPEEAKKCSHCQELQAINIVTSVEENNVEGTDANT